MIKIAAICILLLSSCAVTKQEWVTSYKVTHVEKVSTGFEVYVKMGRYDMMTIMQVLPDTVKPGVMLSFYRFVKVKR